MLAEVFRRHGYEGASIGRIVDETAAGRSSLYHFFPGGKDEMADAVLESVAAWFDRNVFAPLDLLPPDAALAQMSAAADDYFHSGQRICLLGAFALDQTRDVFAARISAYFARWLDSLTGCLVRSGHGADDARTRARQMIATIQGGIVLARASGDDQAFRAALAAIPTLAAHPG